MELINRRFDKIELFDFLARTDQSRIRQPTDREGRAG
jgi:hypothetical protein